MVTPNSAGEMTTHSTDVHEDDRERAHVSARRERNRSRHASPPGPGRAAYFAITGILGFVFGVASLAIAGNLGGSEVTLNTASAMCLIPGAILAALGGGVVARAYRETRRRRG